MDIKRRRGEAPASVYLIFGGVILILIGVITTPIYFSFGNAAFWIGVLVLALGILALLAG